MSTPMRDTAIFSLGQPIFAAFRPTDRLLVASDRRGGTVLIFGSVMVEHLPTGDINAVEIVAILPRMTPSSRSFAAVTPQGQNVR